MATATAAQLIRIARLRRFVGVFARGGDREAAAEALAELSRTAQAGGLAGEALRRARQAAELLVDDTGGGEPGEAGVRSLVQLGAACLDTGDAEAALSASELAHDRAGGLAEPLRSQLTGCAALLAGIAHSIAGAERAARSWLDEARDRLAAAGQPEGAALALTQQALLDVAIGRFEGAEICFGFAREFYRAAREPEAAAELVALAARSFAGTASAQTGRWFSDAIDEADRAGSARLAAELALEYAAELERAGGGSEAAAIAADGVRRCASLDDSPGSRALVLRARLALARLTRDPADALRHVEAAFELALDQRDPAALAGAMEIAVTGLVHGRFTELGWRLVDRFRDRLDRAGFAALADAAILALADLRA
jgi:hypothetical protein